MSKSNARAESVVLLSTPSRGGHFRLGFLSLFFVSTVIFFLALVVLFSRWSFLTAGSVAGYIRQTKVIFALISRRSRGGFGCADVRQRERTCCVRF